MIKTSIKARILLTVLKVFGQVQRMNLLALVTLAFTSVLAVLVEDVFTKNAVLILMPLLFGVLLHSQGRVFKALVVYLDESLRDV